MTTPPLCECGHPRDSHDVVRLGRGRAYAWGNCTERKTSTTGRRHRCGCVGYQPRPDSKEAP